MFIYCSMSLPSLLDTRTEVYQTCQNQDNLSIEQIQLLQPESMNEMLDGLKTFSIIVTIVSTINFMYLFKLVCLKFPGRHSFKDEVFSAIILTAIIV